MTYSIGEVSERMHLPIPTLRYYDKEGLLPFVQRTDAGHRRFSEADLEWLSLIECLKAVGMSLGEIRHFSALYQQGDETLQQRYEIFAAQEQVVLEQIAQYQVMLETLRYKKWLYRAAAEAGDSRLLRDEKAQRACPYQNAYYQRFCEENAPTEP